MPNPLNDARSRFIREKHRNNPALRAQAIAEFLLSQHRNGSYLFDLCSLAEVETLTAEQKQTVRDGRDYLENHIRADFRDRFGIELGE